jgi:hypothetical protein
MTPLALEQLGSRLAWEVRKARIALHVIWNVLVDTATSEQAPPVKTQCLALALCGASLSLGCGGSEQASSKPSTQASGGPGDAGTRPGDASTVDAATCEAVVEEHPAASFDHVTACSQVVYDTNPPSGGNHYPYWPAFQVYTFPVPEGFLVHALEHGAVVIWYNCPDGCTTEIAEAEALINTLPPDPLCAGTGAQRRVILTPDPNLDTRWAASSWGWTLRSACFNASALSDFYAAHYGNGREMECAAGVAFTVDPCP